MASLECPTCGSALANGQAVCGTCGKEMNDDKHSAPFRAKSPGRKNIYAILAVLLAMAGGLVLLMFTGLLPNPIKSSSTVAIVNGEKISLTDLDQKYEVYQKMSGKVSRDGSSTPEGKAAAADSRMQILQTMVQEKILLTEAVKEKISVTPQEIAEKMDVVKKNHDSKDFDGLLKRYGMTLANFERRIEKELLIEKLMAKGTKEKGLTRDAWLAELHKRAKVEIFFK